MSARLAWIGSTPAMLAGFALLAAALAAAHADAGAPSWIIVAPLALLALNLAAAIAAHPRLRRGGLGVFHVALLALMIVAAAGRLARFEGRVEMAEGAALDPSAVEELTRGPLHRFAMPAEAFVQGPISVRYRPGVKRAHTRSEVSVPGEDGSAATRVVGDDEPLVVAGYRFYTTHNKGFAPILTWQPASGRAQTGALHLPSYPLFDWRQENRWRPPGAGELRVWLRLDEPLAEDRAWTLEPRSARGVLVVQAQGTRAELREGEELRLEGGTLRYERLAGWMGYRVFFDPTLPWLLGLALAAAAGLAAYLWKRRP